MISPQPWRVGNSGILLMYSRATNGRELYFSSSSDGKTWAEEQELVGFGGHYQVTNIYGNRLMTAFNYHPGGDADKRTNLYLLQTEDMGKTWKSIDNKIVKTPLNDINSVSLIKDYEAEGKLVYISDLNFDENGNPVLLVTLSNDFNPGPQGGPREWMIIYWRDQKWNFSKVCESTHNYDMGSLYIRGNQWRIIGPTEPGPQEFGTGGEIALWISKNGGITWEKIHNITENSLRNNSFVRRPLNAQGDFYALWTDGDADEFSISQLYFTNEKCNRVWILPYEMIKDFEKPARIK
jgi:hypothetical protein